MVALVAAVFLTACPPPLKPTLPMVVPLVKPAAICVDLLGGTHYAYVTTADGHWGWQFLLLGRWSTTQQVFFNRKGTRVTVVTALPWRAVWLQHKNGKILPPKVMSATITTKATLPCP
jgi:hypothetical protein